MGNSGLSCVATLGVGCSSALAEFTSDLVQGDDAFDARLCKTDLYVAIAIQYIYDSEGQGSGKISNNMT